MNPSTRLKLSALMIFVSTIYGVVVAQDPDVAEAIALGYIAILLTVFILVNVWKKP